MKPTITVVSLGPGDYRLMTLQTLDALKTSRHLFLRRFSHVNLSFPLGSLVL
jgi:precorrin-2 methylase